METLKLIGGSANPHLAQGIANELKLPLVACKRKTFGGGETFVQITENVRGSDLYIIQPTNAPANDNLMELLITVDAARRASAGRITAVIPFFGYARQDRKDSARVPISAKLVANMLEAAGVDRVITMDLHSAQIQGFFDIPVDNLFSAGLLVNYLRGKTSENQVIVSPDVGGTKRAAAISKVLKSPMAIITKTRLSDTEVEIGQVIGDVNGKDAIIVDDMTETMGTLLMAAKACKERGANSVRAAVTHAVLTEDGIYKLVEACHEGIIDRFICTDTVDVDKNILRNVPPVVESRFIKILRTNSLFGQVIKRTHTGESVTELFEIGGF